MKKILVFKDWDEFLETRYPAHQKLLERVAKDHELKDVVEFEATVKKIDWHFLDETGSYLAIVSPPHAKEGDKFLVYAVKQKEEPDEKP